MILMTPHPLVITEKCARVCKETLVLETHIDTDAQRYPFPFLRFYPNGEINNDKTTYFGPNTIFLDTYLKRIGFKSSNTRLIYNGFRSITYAKKDPNYQEDWGQW